jgi:microcompartment protein CcmL/EutN
MIVKAAPVHRLYTGTTHPGKYVVIATGDAASVDVAREAINGDPGPSLIDSLFLADVAPVVAAMLFGSASLVTSSGEAIGVIETRTVASTIDAADAAVKYADVSLASMRLADGLGGNAYFIIDGVVGEVQAGIEAAIDRTSGLINDSVVIPQLTAELREDLGSGESLADRLRDARDRR